MIARLKLIRREAGLPAAAIAKAVGVSLQTVFSWESGKAGVNDKPRAGRT